jgi:hypothetical protein
MLDNDTTVGVPWVFSLLCVVATVAVGMVCPRVLMGGWVFAVLHKSEKH